MIGLRFWVCLRERLVGKMLSDSRNRPCRQRYAVIRNNLSQFHYFRSGAEVFIDTFKYPSGKWDLQPRSADDLCLQVARHCLLTCKNLDMLSYKSSCEVPWSGSLPSWVPCFTAPSSATPCNSRNFRRAKFNGFILLRRCGHGPRSW